jgi:hypothetical protein
MAVPSTPSVQATNNLGVPIVLPDIGFTIPIAGDSYADPNTFLVLAQSKSLRSRVAAGDITLADGSGPLSAAQADVLLSSYWGACGRAVQQLVESKTSAYLVVGTDSQKIFTNEGAGALVVFTLPAALAGLQYTFYVQDADGLQVVAGAGDTIRLSTSVSAVAGNIQSTGTVVGGAVTLVAINDTEWIATSIVGPWVVT